MSIGDGVGKRIKQARETKGMSKSKLAHLSGVTTTAVWNWETNELTPRPETLAKVAACLGLTVEFLRTGTQSPTPAQPATETQTVAAMIEETRARIAQATGFALERVKLHLEFATD